MGHKLIWAFPRSDDHVFHVVSLLLVLVFADPVPETLHWCFLYASFDLQLLQNLSWIFTFACTVTCNSFYMSANFFIYISIYLHMYCCKALLDRVCMKDSNVCTWYRYNWDLNLYKVEGREADLSMKNLEGCIPEILTWGLTVHSEAIYRCYT